MTRLEAETKIMGYLEEIRKTYLDYNPDGYYLNILVMKNYLSAENNFSYGGEDYDHPLSVKKSVEETK